MKLSKTYETWNQDDIEFGDTEKKGFIFENETFTFKELLDELKDECYTELSSSKIDSNTWIKSISDSDYISNDIEIYSLHFKGTDRQKKYWIKALKIHLEIKD